MKSTPDNPIDSLGGLGAPIRDKAPAPAPVPVAPGIVRNSSGQLETQIPPPAPVWQYPVITPAIVSEGTADEWEGIALPARVLDWHGCI